MTRKSPIDEIIELVIEHDLNPQAVAKMLGDVNAKMERKVEKVTCWKCEGTGKITHEFTGFNGGEIEKVQVETRCNVCRGKGKVCQEAK